DAQRIRVAQELDGRISEPGDQLRELDRIDDPDRRLRFRARLGQIESVTADAGTVRGGTDPALEAVGPTVIRPKHDPLDAELDVQAGGLGHAQWRLIEALHEREAADHVEVEHAAAAVLV